MYRIPTRVQNLELKKKLVSARKNAKGEDIIMLEEIGWFVHFEGSYESLYVGPERPHDLEPGTEVDIVIWPRRKRRAP